MKPTIRHRIANRSALAAALSIATVAVLTAGCMKIVVRTETRPGTDLEMLREFAWDENVRLETGDAAIDESGLNETLRAAVDDQLGAKGFRAVDASAADFLVRFDAAVEHRIDEMDLNADQTSRAGWFGPQDDQGYVVEPGTTGQYVREWDEGTLVITFVDRETRKLLWRSQADTELEIYTTDAEERDERARKVVRKMLADLPDH